MKEVWTVGRALEWTRGYFEDKGVSNPLISARWLLSDVSGLSFMELYTRFDRPLDASELNKLHEYVKRRVSGEPLQYITGSTSFYNVEIQCQPGVLIPRPETEQLVDLAIKYLQRFNDDVLVADIGTGSGCIACAIANALPNAYVHAGDINEDALSLASKNVEAHGLGERVEIIRSDIGSGFQNEILGKLDAVISNPPYIPTKIMDELPAEVIDFEPRSALEAGEDGLDVFKKLATWSIDALKKGGLLAVELHETALDEAANEARAAGFLDIEIIHDLADRPRFLYAIK